MKQDRQGVRTPADIERKYNLADLVGIKKAVENNVEGINKTNTTLEEFMTSTLKSMGDLQSQVDGQIATWFYSGVPTLDNLPASEWTTTEIKAEHLGDLYYDNETGYAYRFAINNGIYQWLEIADSGVAEALALANSAQDTADSKRRIFVTTPTIPYDEGDLWLYDDELYVCHTSKATGSFSLDDFRVATKYTDDSALNTFISGEYADDLKTINNQIDKKAETWYQSADPSLNWNTTELKNTHIGDMWFNTSESKNYIYSSAHTWQEADGIPDSVYDAIDGKAQIFASQPVPPYHINDLYVQGATGDIFVCKQERLTGSYTASDWVKASKYTDDTALSTFVNGDYLDNLQAINQQIDKKSETWYQSTDPSIEWETKEVHIGDLWYNTSASKSYMYTDSLKWEEVDGVPDSVFDKIDKKAQIFSSQPVPPYHIGDLYVQGTSGDILVCQKERLTGAYNLSDWVKASKYTDNTALTNFVNGDYANNLQSINNQIDKKAETWYQATDPSLNWTTNELKASHIGDLWFNTTENKSYIYNSSYVWQEADGVPDSVYDRIDTKAQIFASQPTTPYYVGDLYVQGSNGDIYVCKTARLTGSYVASDWVKASKYTDDTALDNFVSGTYANNLQAINQQLDKKAETWYQSTDPALNWTTETRDIHIGDLWYNTNKKKNYVYTSAYEWEEIDGVPDSVYDRIDTKAQIFTSQPVAPYYVGDLYVQGADGDVYVCQKERLSGSYVASEWQKASKYTDDSALNNFVNVTYAESIKSLNDAIDSKIATWYQSSDPSVDWTTTELRKTHIGDLWYNTTDNKNYIYTSSHTWEEIDGVPDSVFDKIDAKAHIFTSQPVPPYHIGDLYVQGAGGEILVCQIERLTGSYTSSDWAKSSKYTDDTALNSFVNNTYTKAINNLNTLIDSKITTWYYSGVPTLSNLPASEWTTTELKRSHIGDLYYDKSTGYTYRFAENYQWEQIIDKDLTEALALANSAQDTADNKRRIFTSLPKPPYDNGDLWFNNQEIYICQISKATGTFATDDFIIATKYTDNTLATQVGENLEVVRGSVLKITEGVDAYKIEFEETVKSIDELQRETIESVERMSYTFGTDNLSIAKSNDPVNTRINNQGLKVYTYRDLQAIFNHRGAGIQKLITVGDAQLGNISIVKARDENGNACTDINYLVSNVQTLSDLEGE